MWALVLLIAPLTLTQGFDASGLKSMGDLSVDQETFNDLVNLADEAIQHIPRQHAEMKKQFENFEANIAVEKYGDYLKAILRFTEDDLLSPPTLATIGAYIDVIGVRHRHLVEVFEKLAQCTPKTTNFPPIGKAGELVTRDEIVATVIRAASTVVPAYTRILYALQKNLEKGTITEEQHGIIMKNTGYLSTALEAISDFAASDGTDRKPQFFANNLLVIVGELTNVLPVVIYICSGDPITQNVLLHLDE